MKLLNCHKNLVLRRKESSCRVTSFCSTVPDVEGMASIEDDGYEEGRSAFVKHIEELLLQGNPQSVFLVIDEPNNSEFFTASGYELIPILGRYLTCEVKTVCSPMFDCSRQILERIARELTPQETYLELLELTEDSDDVKFLTTLEIIKFCLLRMPRQRGKSICWVCDAIVRHLCHMEVPEEGVKSRVFSKSADIGNNIREVYKGIVGFFEPFVNEVQSGNFEVSVDHVEEYKSSLISCLVKCLGRPLVHIDLSEESKHHSLAGDILNMIDALVYDPLSFLSCVDLSFGCAEMLEVDAVSTEFNNVSLGCYFYLVFRDDRHLQNISHVFSPHHLFECAMAMCFDLMSTNETPLVFKALSLFDSILDRISKKTVDFNSVQDTVMSKFLEMITRNMVYNDTKQVRQLSVKIFPKFLNKITTDGQYLVLFNANQLSSDPGFMGFSITLVKELVREALDTQDPIALHHFSGKKLKDLMSRYCKITNIIEADLHSHTDLIISCLNLARYVLLRDKKDDLKMSSYLLSFDDSYLEPVKKACSLARGIYEDYKMETQESLRSKVEVNVAGFDELVPEMSVEEQHSMMTQNLMRVDMIEFLASRVSQCLADYKNNHRTICDA